MSKYTEDDLREELKTKEYEYGFYTGVCKAFKVMFPILNSSLSVAL